MIAKKLDESNKNIVKSDILNCELLNYEFGKSLKYNEFISVKGLPYFCNFIFFREDTKTIIYEGNSGVRETTLSHIKRVSKEIVIADFKDKIEKYNIKIKDVNKILRESKKKQKYAKRVVSVFNKREKQFKDRLEAINLSLKFFKDGETMPAEIARRISYYNIKLNDIKDILGTFRHAVNRLQATISSAKISLAECNDKIEMHTKNIEGCVNNEF